MCSKVVDHVFPMSSTRAAEMTKLLENIHWAVNVGLVNEMKVVADRVGINIYEVIDAAATKSTRRWMPMRVRILRPRKSSRCSRTECSVMRRRQHRQAADPSGPRDPRLQYAISTLGLAVATKRGCAPNPLQSIA